MSMKKHINSIINDNCNETCLGNVYYHNNSDRLVVWFNNVAHWASGEFENSFYDFQIIIYFFQKYEIDFKNY